MCFEVGGVVGVVWGCFVQMLVVSSMVSGESFVAGVHAEGALANGELCQFLSRRQARRQRVAGQSREDLGRRVRSRGEQLCAMALKVVT